jgi:HEAT repeats
VIENHDFDEDQSATARRRGPSRKYPWAIVVVVALFVIAPFLSWYGSWFGRELSPDKMEAYLHDENKPRNVQHALSQIANRIIAGDESVKQWYPSVISAAWSSSAEVRVMAAWVMGQDNKNTEFHSALLPMLEDSHPGVRHNAALALVRFNDSAARPELVAMLKPNTLRAAATGKVELIVKDEGTAVAANAPLARIKREDGQTLEMRSPEAGHIQTLAVSDGATVDEGGELLTLSPETEQVWSALVALYIIGQPDDTIYIQRYTGQVPGMPDRVIKQASATLEAIRERARNAGQRF